MTDKSKLAKFLIKQVITGDSDLSFYARNKLKETLTILNDPEDEETHSENCSCCGNFLRMEAQYDSLRKNILAYINKRINQYSRADSPNRVCSPGGVADHFKALKRMIVGRK